jgi:hypothetical protein
MRAQSSVEFLVIFAVTLLGLLIFMGISQSEGIGITQTKYRAQAQNTVSDIAFAAEGVYAQGLGAKKKITVTIPMAYDSSLSYVGNQSIRLHSNGADYVSSVDFEVYGSLPATSGKHDVWVISEGDKVRIGNALIQSNRQSINAIMASNATRDETFTLTNVWNSSFTVTITQDWNNPDVSLALDSNVFGLNKGESREVTATFSSGDDSSGFYPGYLNITANDGANSESIEIPITIEVAELKSSDGPALTIVPSNWSVDLARGANSTYSFQVCTNHETTLNTVDFIPSVGEPGDWIGLTDSLTNLDPSTCIPKTLMVSIPSDADISTHSGFVYLRGDVAEAADVLSFEANVGGWANDTIAPNITSLDVFPTTRIFENKPVAVRAIVDDSGRGDNAIAGCNVSIDGGSTYQMISADGSFDEMIETAGYTFYSGYTIGTHNVTVDCADVKGNSVQQNTTFVVVKDFLFITQNVTPSTDEQAWMDWIDNGRSDEAFSWDMDSTDSATFIAGSPNLSHYTTVVAAVWSSGMETRLNNFVSSGGSIVMLGSAAADAPNALGLSSSVGTQDSNTSIDIVDNTHYISSNYSNVISVTNTSITFGAFWKDVGGSLLGKSMIGSPPHWHVLAASGTNYFWGPYTPDYFDADGLIITTRVFDHAVNSSTIG